jgi:16S rRNA (uracil1498-N3)-methyltransferase
MYLFYSETILGNYHVLSRDESKHCIKVLRLKKGDVIHLTDGKGNLYETIIAEDNINKCRLGIRRVIPEYGRRNFSLHIAIAPTKNINRLEWFLEKATEIGIDRITPLICKHSERKNIQPDRLKKVMVSAMKQSLKAYLPILDAAVDLQKFIQHDFHAEKYIAYCSENFNGSLKESYTTGKDVLILIGPEGDFSADEVNKALTAGFKPITLGPARLRTETAALVACASVNFLNL